MSRKRISRRRFVGDMASGVAFTIVPAHVLGRRHVPPSDKLNIACIGVGGMGANDVRGVGKTENIYALCDVDDRQGAQSFSAFPKAKRYKDFRALLDKEGESIDAVTVSTPDHTHTVAGMMAMKLGKHTRIQKPLARTLWEVKQLEEAATKYKVATQMGNQGHAEEGTRQIREWVEAGAIGTVREIELWTNRPIWPQALDRPLEEYYTPPWIDWDLWLGPAPERPYNPAYAPFKWRGWWDFGTGALGDIACHSMDASFWALDLGYPAPGIAYNYLACSAALRRDLAGVEENLRQALRHLLPRAKPVDVRDDVRSGILRQRLSRLAHDITRANETQRSIELNTQSMIFGRVTTAPTGT